MTVEDGIPVTTVPRTIFDLAAVSTVDVVEYALKESEYLRLNAWIDLGDKRFRVDFLWSPQNQIVELDGWEGHGTRTAFRDDRARDRRLRVAGYAITRLTWSQLEDEPTAIAADLRTLVSNTP